MKRNSQYSKILWIVLIFFLSSCKECNKCNEEQTLEVYRSVKKFYIMGSKNQGHILANGIWKVTGDNNNFRELVVYKRESIDVPHSVEIKCYEPDGYCTLRETVLVSFLNYVYAVSSSDNTFQVNTWDNDKIIATMYDFHDSCLKRILQIDLHTQEVLVKSILKDNMNAAEFCSRYKDKSMPIVNKLVDESESDWEYFISVTKKPKTKK